ncbi:hypothetical protein H4I96_05187 [Botrytis cinerea]
MISVLDSYQTCVPANDECARIDLDESSSAIRSSIEIVRRIAVVAIAGGLEAQTITARPSTCPAIVATPIDSLALR